MTQSCHFGDHVGDFYAKFVISQANKQDGLEARKSVLVNLSSVLVIAFLEVCSSFVMLKPSPCSFHLSSK